MRRRPCVVEAPGRRPLKHRRAVAGSGVAPSPSSCPSSGSTKRKWFSTASQPARINAAYLVASQAPGLGSAGNQTAVIARRQLATGFGGGGPSPPLGTVSDFHSQHQTELGVGRPPPALSVVNGAFHAPPMRPCRVCNTLLDLALPVHACCVCHYHHCDGCGTETDQGRKWTICMAAAGCASSSTALNTLVVMPPGQPRSESPTLRPRFSRRGHEAIQ